MQRFAAVLAMALLFAFTGFNAHAETRTINAKCSLKIDGVTHMNSQCHFSSDARGDSFDDLRLLIVCPNGRSAETTNCYGYEQRTARSGVFGYLFRSGGVAQLCWNGGTYRKAQECYEGLRRTGACWANSHAPSTDNAKQTRNIELCAWRI